MLLACYQKFNITNGIYCFTQINFILAQILKRCHPKDPNLKDCLRNAIESIRVNLTDGIPELLIPPCEPLKIPEINIKQNAGAIRIESEYSDMTIYGFSNFTLRDISVDVPKKRLQADLWFPELGMTSNYLIHGKLLLMPITGSGKAYGNFSKYTINNPFINSFLRFFFLKNNFEITSF